MKVKELFAKLDKDDIIRAFRHLYNVFPEYEMDRLTTEEIVAWDKRFEEAAKNLIDDICNMDDYTAEEDFAVFVVQLESEVYDNKSKKDYDTFIIQERELKEKAGGDFELWDYDGMVYISNYAYDMSPLEEIANYRIAEQSIEECSALTCAVVIFDEIIFFGMNKDSRKRNIEEVEADLIRADEEAAHTKGIPAEEVFKELRQEFMDSLTDEDDRKYYELKDAFQEETREIEQRWWRKTFERNHEKKKNHIKAEWQRLYGIEKE